MYLFIDTNIFLSFYHLTNEDLEELEKLVTLIKNKEITLYLTEQVVDEFKRNRSNKINDGFTKFNSWKPDLHFPAYCKNYKEYEEIKKLIKEVQKSHSNLKETIGKDIIGEKLKADALLKDIFSIAKILNRTPEAISRAKNRIDLGNPPGKEGSMGDAINWECLLYARSKYWTMHFITDDKDFQSSLDPEKFNEFLLEEWQKEKGCKIFFYRKLSDFFKKHYPKINLQAEAEKDRLINQLSLSGSFAATHIIIAKLSSYEEFTQKQAEDLMAILINNDQVNWIINDLDVKNFYTKLDAENFLFFESNYDEFKKILQSGELPNLNDIGEDVDF